MLTNCAAMNVPPDQARRLTLWEYSGMLHHYNQRLDPEGKNAAVEAPDVETILTEFHALERSGFARMPTAREIN